MLARQRQALILERIRDDGAVRVADLVRLLGVSDMTVRRDLESLHEQGMVEKVHGGATARTGNALFEPGFAAKSALQQHEKEAIAAAAVALVEPGMAIGLSAGTTTYALARALIEIPRLTVVTNSIPVADALYVANRSDQTIILTGGERTPSDALVGPFAVAALRSVHLDIVFMGVHGMEPRSGFTTPNMLEAETDRVLIEAGRRLVVVADHSKWGVVGISSIARLDEADTLISDGQLEPEARTILRESVRDLVLVAEAAPGPLGLSSMAIADRFDGPHRRYDALTDQWVLVSAGRTQRPWQGLEEDETDEARPAYDPTCYLCPGNPRALGDVNPDYATTFVFTNDFAALSPETPTERIGDGLLVAEGESGTCRVICFSPRHDLTLGLMSPEAVRTVVDVWAAQTAELGGTYRWVQVFENRGESMGASNPHPHGQIWAGTALPREAAREDAAQRRHCDAHGERLLLDYARQETGGPRVVEENDEWLIVVPFWATWPFETLVIPRRPVERLPGLDDAQRDALAAGLIRLLGRYDALFDRPFPYSMGWHQAPFGGGDGEASGDGRTDHWQLHGHFYPPLLRATVRKFMVGYELLAETQRDLTAEEAAERLRAAEPATKA